jgi:hypothetical protein
VKKSPAPKGAGRQGENKEQSINNRPPLPRQVVVPERLLRDLLADVEEEERRLRALAENVDGEISAQVEQSLAGVKAVADRLVHLIYD